MQLPKLLHTLRDGPRSRFRAPRLNRLRLNGQTFQLAAISRSKNPDFGTRRRARSIYFTPVAAWKLQSAAIDETIGRNRARRENARENKAEND